MLDLSKWKNTLSEYLIGCLSSKPSNVKCFYPRNWLPINKFTDKQFHIWGMMANFLFIGVMFHIINEIGWPIHPT